MASTETSEPTQSEAPPPVRRSPTPWIVAGVVVVLVAVAVAVVLLTRGGGDDDVAEEAPPIPTTDVRVTIAAGEPIQPAVDAAEPGTTFVLEAGTHRQQQVTPRPGDIFEGAGEGTVLNGAKVLEGWQADGGTWSVGGQSQQGVVHGQCRPEAPRCGHPEELFVDGERLRHVASLDQVDAESWYFDYDADRIHVGVDPSGSVVETSVTPFAFRGDANGVQIRNLTVTHYANQSQYGAIHAEGPDWTIEQVTSQRNHATGFFIVGDRGVIRDSRSIENGQLGIGATTGADGLIERVEVIGNNTNGFDDEWEGGGLKFTLTDDQVVTDSHVEGNDGAGIWYDESAIDSTTTANRVVDNTGAGIFYEISEGGTVEDNEVTGNGFGEASKDWAWGAGIQVAGSHDITIRDNRLSGNYHSIMLIQQERGGSDRVGEYRLDDIEITANTIVLGDEEQIGAATDIAGSDVYERDLKFVDNSYEVDEAAEVFTWNNENYDLAGWTDLGQS